MDYLLIKIRPNKKIKEVEMYAIFKYDFVMWAIKQTKSSINLKDIRKIGKLILDLNWLKGVKR